MPVLNEIIFEKVYEIFDENFPDHIKIEKEILRENLFSGKYKMYALSIRDEIIGAFIYNPIISLSGCVFIEYIFIKKEYQNRGYGKRFIKDCLGKLKKYKTIYLDCEKNLISYYEKLDFKSVNICKYDRTILHLMCFGKENKMFTRHWLYHL